MKNTNSTIAKQIGHAASAFELRRTGHLPKSVNVVLNGDTLVITLRGALSPAERETARSPAAARQMKEFHRNLFDTSADSLRQEIKTITGADVLEASAEVETINGAVMQMYASGTIVQVFLLTGGVAVDTWSGSAPGTHP